MEAIDKSKLFEKDMGALVDNLIGISKDMRVVTSKVQTPEGEKTMKLLHELLWRLEPLKPKEIRS